MLSDILSLFNDYFMNKLIDFGNAVNIDRPMHQSWTFKNNLGGRIYKAPEFEEEPYVSHDGKSDMYSLGRVVFKLRYRKY